MKQFKAINNIGHSAMNDFTYFFKRKFWQIRNVLKWLPIIWNQFDFDYTYSIEVFKFQLLKQAELMENNGMLMNSEYQAKRIRTIIKLMDRVYDEYYGMEYFDTVTKLYGEFEYVFEPIGETMYNPITKEEEELSEMKKVWVNEYTENELKRIDLHIGELISHAQEKQKKAHRVLWLLIEHNIQGFWD